MSSEAPSTAFRSPGTSAFRRLPPDPAAFDAFVRKKQRGAWLALVIVLAFDAALMIFEHRLMIFALAALTFPLVPWLVARGARQTVGPNGAVGLATTAEGFELVTQRAGARETEKLGVAALKKALPHPNALEIHVLDYPDGRTRYRRLYVAGGADDVRAMAQELAAQGIEIGRPEGMGTIALVLGLAFGYVLGPLLLLLGLVLLVQAALHPEHGLFFQAGLVLVFALTVIAVAITWVRRRRRRRPARDNPGSR